MNLALLKRDPVIRWTPVASVLAGLLALLLHWTFPKSLFLEDGLAADTGRLDAVWLAPMLLIPALQSLLVHARYFSVRTRADTFERALPVSLRSVVFQSVLASWIGVVAPLLTGAAVLALAMYSRTWEPSLFATATGNALMATTAGVLVLFAWRPAALSLGLVETVLLCLAALACVMLPTFVDAPWGQAVHFAAVPALLAWLYIRVPRGMPADRVVGARRRRLESSARDPLWSRWLSPLNWTILRSTVLRPASLWIFILGGVLVATGFDHNIVLQIWFPVIIVYQGVNIGLIVLNGVGALPVKRSRLLPCIVLPPLAVIMAVFVSWGVRVDEYPSYGGLANGVDVDGGSDETFGGEREYATHVRVPPHLWKFGRSSQDRIVTAPWGETVEPMIHPLFFGANSFAFNPYDVTDQSSVRLATWQLSRAMRAVYGWEVEPDEVRERWYPEIDPQACVGDVRLLQHGARPWGDHEPLLPPNRPASAALLAIVLWFLCAAYALRRNTPGRTRGAWQRSRWGHQLIIAALIGGMMFVAWLSTFDRALPGVLLAKAHLTFDAALGSSVLAWIALDVFVAAVSYAILSQRIQRLEVPPILKHGWTKKEMSVF